MITDCLGLQCALFFDTKSENEKSVKEAGKTRLHTGWNVAGPQTAQ